MVDTDDSDIDDRDASERNDETSRRLVSGWDGRYYEDFEVGDSYKHPYGRTVTETDNVWFTNVSMNLNPMHFNEAYAPETEFGERLVDGTCVIALAVGMSVFDVFQNATASLGYDDIRHHAPVFHSDTLFADSEILDKRESDPGTTSESSPPSFGRTTSTTTWYCHSNELRWC